MTPTAADSSIHPAQQAVMDLYATDLSSLKFPDVDHAVLEAAAKRVQTDAQAVKVAEEALAAARATMAESQEVLMQKCQRALAYARVYAEENPDLAQKVDAITLPKAGKRGSRGSEIPTDASEESKEAAPKRRGRKPQASGALFADEGTLEGESGGNGHAAEAK